jgi:hypothetical protein
MRNLHNFRFDDDNKWVTGERLVSHGTTLIPRRLGVILRVVPPPPHL